MAYEQENGWPLGLQPLNVRIGLVRNHDFSGSMSFNTLLTDSITSSTDFSSDLDTESTAGSFFNDRSITLGSLIDLSGRSSSIRGITKADSSFREVVVSQRSTSFKSKMWFFSLCSKTHHIVADHNEEISSTDQIFMNHPPSLAHFLEVERKATTANDYKRSTTTTTTNYESSDNGSESNTLFVNGHIAPPPPPQSSTTWFGSEIQRRSTASSSVFFSCICGQPTI